MKSDADSGRLAEVVAAIALASDLALGQPLDHALRSSAIAMRFSDRLGLSADERATTYWVTLFVGTGCTAGSFELSRIFGDDIALRAEAYEVGPSVLDQLRYLLGHAGAGRPALGKALGVASLLIARMRPLEEAIHAHCAISARLASHVGLGEPVTSAVAQCYAYWNGGGFPSGLKHDEIPLSARICAIADSAEVIHRERGTAAAIADARARRGIVFDPFLADRWCEVAPSVLDTLDGDVAWKVIMAAQLDRPLSVREFEDSLELLGDYADLKSPWFGGHSRGVAALAEAAGREAGMPETDVAILRRAALLHDLGRSGIPNTIWDKPGPLTDAERERVRLTPYFTDRILHRVGGLAHLAPVASAAYEWLDGTGYPRAIAGETIPFLGRLLACAHTYHAMREDRPQRAALSREEAAAQLRHAGRAGKLDGAAVDAVLAAAGHPARRRPTAPGGLTPREIEVLGLAARGATARQIADRLGITPKTAGNHIERVYEKTGVSSRAEAALWAMQNGLMGASET